MDGRGVDGHAFVPVQYDKLRSEKTDYTVSEESVMASYNPQMMGEGTHVLEMNTLPMPPENVKSYEDVDLPELSRSEADGWAVLLTPHMNHVHVRKAGFGEGLWGVYRSEEAAQKAAARARKAVPYMYVRVQRKGSFALLGREAADARGDEHLTEIYSQIWGSNYAEAEEQNRGLVERIEEIVKTDFEQKLDKCGPYADLPCEFTVYDDDVKGMRPCGVPFRNHECVEDHPYMHRIRCLQEVVVGYRKDGGAIVRQCGIDVRDHWEARWRKHENCLFLRHMFAEFVFGDEARGVDRRYPDYDHTFMNDEMKIGEHIYHQMRMEKTWGAPKNKEPPVRQPYLPACAVIAQSLKDIMHCGGTVLEEDYCREAVLYLSFCARKNCETPETWWENEFATFREKLPLVVSATISEISEEEKGGKDEAEEEEEQEEEEEEGGEEAARRFLRQGRHLHTTRDTMLDNPYGSVSVDETPSASDSGSEEETEDWWLRRRRCHANPLAKPASHGEWD